MGNHHNGRDNRRTTQERKTQTDVYETNHVGCRKKEILQGTERSRYRRRRAFRRLNVPVRVWRCGHRDRDGRGLRKSNGRDTDPSAECVIGFVEKFYVFDATFIGSSFRFERRRPYWLREIERSVALETIIKRAAVRK